MTKAARLYEMLIEGLLADEEEYFEAVSGLATLYCKMGNYEAAECLALKADSDIAWRYPKPAGKLISTLSVVYRAIGQRDELKKILESRLSRLKGKKNEYARAMLQVELAAIYGESGDSGEARKLLEKAESVAASHREVDDLHLIRFEISKLNMHEERFDEAVSWCAEALRDKTARRLHYAILNVLGLVWHGKGKYARSLQCLTRSAAITEKSGDLVNTIATKLNIGNIHFELREFDKALDYYVEARRFFESVGDNINLGGTLLNIGNIDGSVGRIEDAISAYREAIAIAEREQNSRLRVFSMWELANACSRAGRMSECFNAFGQVISLCSELGLASDLASLSCQYASAIIKLTGDVEKARKYVQQAADIAMDKEFPNWLAEALKVRATIKAADGEHDGALEDLKNARKLSRQHSLKIEQSIQLAEIPIFQASGQVKRASKALKALGKVRDKLLPREQAELYLHTLNQKVILHTADEDGEDDVRTFVRTAAKTAERAADKVMEWRTAAASAELLLAHGLVPDARSEMKRAVEIVGEILDTLPEGINKEQVMDSPAYEEIVNIVKKLEGKRPPGKAVERPAERAADSSPDPQDDLTVNRSFLTEAGVDSRLLTRDGIALLSMTSRLFSADLEPQNMLDLMLGMVLDVTDAERGFVILLDSRGKLHHKSARNIEDKEITSPEYETSFTMVQQVIKSGKPRLVEDALSDRELGGAQSVVNLQLRSVLCVPIVAESEIIGVVYVDSTSIEKRFTENEQALLEAFAEKCSGPLKLLLRHEEDQRKIENLGETLKTTFSYSNIVAGSKPMREVIQLLDKVTDTDLSVYIYGETGTGKELIAKALHSNSSRRDAPFIAINCAAMPESLLESELFGHVKGAFTGANSDKTGLIEAADEGTLYLDEVGSMPLEMQAKFLRVLEEREIRPIGATTSSPVDIRLVCSTNTSLEELVEKELFREDLFYRLNVVRIELPPLSTRREDIPVLARHFIKEFAKELKTGEKSIDDGALAKLLALNYPGNVRQLRNILQQAFVRAGGSITPNDIEKVITGQEHQPEPESAVSRKLSLDDYMKEFILAHQSYHNETELAGLLGITRDTLWRKRKSWDLPRPR
ncbi:MAG: tetratricopeptide repeat protein [Planctomycetota bacterium]|nr:MAG: tetratricopeptide repeat protein [Planctomycetota bacterium]